MVTGTTIDGRVGGRRTCRPRAARPTLPGGTDEPAPLRHPGRVRPRARPLRGPRPLGGARRLGPPEPVCRMVRGGRRQARGGPVRRRRRGPLRRTRDRRGDPTRGGRAGGPRPRCGGRRARRADPGTDRTARGVRRRGVGESVAERHRHARRGRRGAVVGHDPARRRHPRRASGATCPRTSTRPRRCPTSPTC